MANAVKALIFGNDYQACWFWMQICRLFDDRSKVIRVAYEKDNVKSFDDVVVFYDSDMFDEENHPLSADYYQVKFHVTADGACTWEGMMNPAFINASSVSILQRLKNAKKQYTHDGFGSRFLLYTPWFIHPDDLLARVYSLTDGSLRWEKLSAGGPKSAMGKIRTAWRDHLEVENDEELRVILRPLRILQGKKLNELRETLNDRLRLAGLIPVEAGRLSHPYEELTRKLFESGQTEFIRTDVEQICKREKLWKGYSMPEPDAYRVGIRSFLRWAEYLEDETDTMLCLLKYFDGRSIKSPDLWQSAIFPEVSEFLSQAMRGHEPYHLYLHTHASIAFAAGYCLDTKAGISAAPIQSTSSGREIWRPDPSQGGVTYPAWEFTNEFGSPDGLDTALALSVTHDVLDDITAYSPQIPQPIRRIISCRLPAGPNNQAILNGTHAKLLANQLADFVKTNRTREERQGTLHIFAAAPNGLLFFVGQLARSFGSCILYEYAFESNVPGAYQPSLIFPPSISSDGYKE